MVQPVEEHDEAQRRGRGVSSRLVEGLLELACCILLYNLSAFKVKINKLVWFTI